ESHVHQALYVAQNRRLEIKELEGVGDRHVEHVSDRLAAVEDFERLAVVSRAVTDVAVHVDVGQKMHLDLDRAVPRTGLAAPALHVEGESSGLIPANLGLL